VAKSLAPHARQIQIKQNQIGVSFLKLGQTIFGGIKTIDLYLRLKNLPQNGQNNLIVINNKHPKRLIQNLLPPQKYRFLF